MQQLSAYLRLNLKNLKFKDELLIRDVWDAWNPPTRLTLPRGSSSADPTSG